MAVKHKVVHQATDKRPAEVHLGCDCQSCTPSIIKACDNCGKIPPEGVQSLTTHEVMQILSSRKMTLCFKCVKDLDACIVKGE